MSTDFLRSDGSLSSRPSRLAGWLPSATQMTQGAQAQFDQPLSTALDSPFEDTTATPWTSSMRQGMGMVVAAALVAGILPVVLAWLQATRLGTVVPLAQLAELAEIDADAARWIGPFADLLTPFQTLAGLEPVFFPGWLAALLSALGVWINWPLRWLMGWIVYGLGVMVGAKLLGATTTLQRFYALTAYAALPLILLALGPIPCLGAVATVIGVVWAVVVYVAATRAATGFSLARTVACVAMPAAVGVLLGLMLLTVTTVTLLRVGL